MKTSIEDLTLVQLIEELKRHQEQLNYLIKIIQNISHQISFKIEVAENELIQDELINKPITELKK